MGIDGEKKFGGPAESPSTEEGAGGGDVIPRRKPPTAADLERHDQILRNDLHEIHRMQRGEFRGMFDGLTVENALKMLEEIRSKPLRAADQSPKAYLDKDAYGQFTPLIKEFLQADKFSDKYRAAVYTMLKAGGFTYQDMLAYADTLYQSERRRALQILNEVYPESRN